MPEGLLHGHKAHEAPTPVTRVSDEEEVEESNVVDGDHGRTRSWDVLESRDPGRPPPQLERDHRDAEHRTIEGPSRHLLLPLKCVGRNQPRWAWELQGPSLGNHGLRRVRLARS